MDLHKFSLATIERIVGCIDMGGCEGVLDDMTDAEEREFWEFDDYVRGVRASKSPQNA